VNVSLDTLQPATFKKLARGINDPTFRQPDRPVSAIGG
jgi:hypothetical protein